MIGPEAPLVDGLADNLRAMGMLGLRPEPRSAAQLEGSKGFTKDLCARARHPDRALMRAHRTGLRREAALGDFGLPVVIKADGLAAGKGVIIAETAAEARAPRSTTCSTAASARAGEAVVIEEFMEGEEVSFFALDRRRDRGARSAPPRTTSASATATPAPIPAAWAPTARRVDLHAASSSARALDEIVGPTVAGAGRGRHALSRRALCRADAHRGGPEAGRI